MTQLIGIQCCTLWHVNSLEHMKTFPQEIIYNHFVNVASSNKKIYYNFMFKNDFLYMPYIVLFKTIYIYVLYNKW